MIKILFLHLPQQPAPQGPIAQCFKIDAYLKFGGPHVWVIDPADRRTWTYTLEGNKEVKDGLLRTENPSIEVSLAEVFAGLDDARS